jgi:IS30 family transposase
VRGRVSVPGRDVGTVYRELARGPNVYRARTAHHKAYVRRKYAKYQGMKLQEDMKLNEYVTKHGFASVGL